MNDDKLNAAMVRGARAQELLRSELLQECFAQLEADYIETWKTLPALATEAAERLRIAVNVVGKVKEHLERVAANGRLAQTEIDALVAADKVLKHK